jgi:hypothetical protein
MAAPRCYNCMYSCVDPERWLRCLCRGESLLPRCANHPWWPGQMHDVPGTACRNYRPRPVLPEGDAVRLIPLGDGYYAYVDAADYERLNRYAWHLVNGYATRREEGRTIYMHREIMRPPKGMVVDHIDGNRVNNCQFNLRNCTAEENRQNHRKQHGSRSRFKGVFYHRKSHKLNARCKHKGHVYSLGYYDDELEAARVYDRAAVEYFGEFARVNFPEEWPPQRRAEVYAQRQKADGEVKRKRAKVKKPSRKTQAARRTTKSARIEDVQRCGRHRKPGRWWDAREQRGLRWGVSGRVCYAHSPSDNR